MQKPVCKSPIVRHFWETIGGRNPTDSVIRTCDRIIQNSKKREPPFQSSRYEYAELLGIPVVERSMPDRNLQGFISENKNGYLIVVNSDDPPERRSFTVCHELGHIQMLTTAEAVLGRAWLRNRVSQIKGRNEEERLSDFFAANLLMPRAQFKEAASSLIPSVESLIKLKDIFFTSLTAAAHRIVDLNVWSCVLMSCKPFKLANGSFVVEINRFRSSKSVANSPVARDQKFVRWGIDAVYEAYNNQRIASSMIKFRHPAQHKVELWRIECAYRESQRESDSILALMLPR